MPRHHIAILDEEFPYPLNSGKRIRTFNLITRLAKSHRITYIAHDSPNPEQRREAARVLRQYDIFPLIAEYRVPPKSGPMFYARLMRNLLSPLPYSVATHTSRQLSDAADKVAREDPPDLWHCEWTPYAHTMFRRLGHWVVMAHNVESLIWRRYMEAEENPLKRWFLEKQWKRFVRFEGWAYSNATRAIAVSREDADRMERDFGAKNVAVVENGVDTSYFQPDDTTSRDPHRMLFLGSLDWRPNLDAIRQLLDSILPRVQKAEPKARLSIVGRSPPDWLRSEVANRPGVELHADVPDVRPFLHSAGMLVVPLRIGGGSRLKILEALTCTTPVVTTTIGVEGLRLTNEHCAIADGDENFAKAVLEAMHHPQMAHMHAGLGRSRVLAEYDWNELATKLGDVWQEAIAGDVAQRD